MESTAHWETLADCVLCGQVRDNYPLWHCPARHQYCDDCHKNLISSSKNLPPGYATCILCKFAGIFTETPLSSDFLVKIKTTPGIGRPLRYTTNQHADSQFHYTRNIHDEPSPSIDYDEDKKFEVLIGMSKEEFYSRQANKKDVTKEKEQRNSPRKALASAKSKFHLPSYSRGPLKCPHMSCHKTVAVAQFVNHFKSDHSDVRIFSIERGKELCLPCDISVVEHGLHFCLAMINIYEINQVMMTNVDKSLSSESVRRTCRQFCQKIPINSFWLMVTGSKERKSSCSYCFFWMFTNSEVQYKCSIELGSKKDSVSLSSYCSVINLLTNEHFFECPANMKCLLVTKSSLKAILREGVGLNLRIRIH